jgi:hypothetical protein
MDYSTLGNRTVIIKIGPDAKPFTIHENLLADSSPYFRKAFRGKWKESQNREIALDDVTERTFDVVTKWVYSQKLCKPQITRDKERIEVKQELLNTVTTGHEPPPTTRSIPFMAFKQNTQGIGNDKSVVSENYVRGTFQALDHHQAEFWNWDDLLDVALFAHIYDTPHLYTDVIKQWIEQAKKPTTSRVHCTFATVLRAYEHFPETSSMCRLISHTYAKMWEVQSKEDLDFMREQAPKAFLAEVLVAKADLYSHIDPFQLASLAVTPRYCSDPCVFHEHVDEERDKNCVGTSNDACHKDYCHAHAHAHGYAHRPSHPVPAGRSMRAMGIYSDSELDFDDDDDDDDDDLADYPF